MVAFHVDQWKETARSAKVAGPVRFVVNERQSIQGGIDGYR